MLKKHLFCLALIGFSLSTACFATEPAGQTQDREIAITIDDLPFVGSANGDATKLQREHDRFLKIMQALIDNKVPATGFVIAGSIEKGQWELLEAFHQAGFILGNHTFSHANLNTTKADKYIDNVDQADKMLTPLMSETKYFRYPYLAESSGEKKRLVTDYLSAHQYVIAPVTIDSKDFIFNEQLYRIPYRMREKSLEQLKRRYLAYIWNQTLKAENRAQKEGKPAKQILLIHANLLNSYLLGDIIELYKQKGYRFISLSDALKAPAPAITAPSDAPKEQFEMIFHDSVLNSLFRHYKS